MSANKLVWIDYTQLDFMQEEDEKLKELLSQQLVTDASQLSVEVDSENRFSEIDVNGEDAETEKKDLYDEVRRLYVSMLLKIREGHMLPGVIMHSISLGYSGLLESFLSSSNALAAIGEGKEHLAKVRYILESISETDASYIMAQGLLRRY
ncbi:unnamed protein product [Didymodactylos carnosus]|uniref:Uncharacterized protein n=1 Tax=Didymodactylos carnosus TaxID=1234261 RepID=A0A815LZ08_9BILA|nr:unnamed protein product [Didymodactylos carnosus]CAF4302168.1 unnamed protein product [Didymodactylos carnosus]